MVAKLFNYSWDFAQVPTEDSRGGKLKDFIDKEDWNVESFLFQEAIGTAISFFTPMYYMIHMAQSRSAHQIYGPSDWRF